MKISPEIIYKITWMYSAVVRHNVVSVFFHYVFDEGWKIF